MIDPTSFDFEAIGKLRFYYYWGYIQQRDLSTNWFQVSHHEFTNGRHPHTLTLRGATPEEAIEKGKDFISSVCPYGYSFPREKLTYK